MRNRLTHTIEVADIGRTLARLTGKHLLQKGIATAVEVECVQCIVENACLLHDLGNPPFGHFGEEAIKNWFRFKKFGSNESSRDLFSDSLLADFLAFDGNPQGFRIATRLHCEVDEHALNLTASTLLASVKYPNCGDIPKTSRFPKKVGIFSSERDIYLKICKLADHSVGQRYFLAYLMELADDICYCLSDIADSFEKGIVDSRGFKAEFARICGEQGVEYSEFIPDDTIDAFAFQVAIPLAREVMAQASAHFAENLQAHLDGTAPELAAAIPLGKLLECMKIFARRFIYTDREAQRIEIAGERIVNGLLDHFGRLLRISRSHFHSFTEGSLPKGAGLDTEWRIFHQLSPRMLNVYRRATKDSGDSEEWVHRARLIVDYISGLTDDSALEMYQNLMGIKL